jgi:hypothetical protein
MKLGNQPSKGEMEAAKESERLLFHALREFDEHTSRTEKSHHAKELVHEKPYCAIAQVEVTKEQEMLISSGITKASILLR